jgi:nucleoside 2-deoxyribosyltransferase
MDIFFSGSIRGGRSDGDLYATLIATLADYGEVLTEHVGVEGVEETEAEQGLSDRQIHDRDVAWLRRADVVVAEVTTPSLGVGYEVGLAVEWEKPTCCLYRPAGDHDLSAMIRGNDAVTLETYQQPADLEAPLETFLQDHA